MTELKGSYSLKQRDIVFNNVKYAMALENLFDNVQNPQQIDNLKNEIIQKYDLTKIKRRISEFRKISSELKKTISITQNIKEKLDLYNASSQKSLEFITGAYGEKHIAEIRKNSQKYKEWKDLVSQAVIKPFGFTFGAYLPRNELNKLRNLNLSQTENTDTTVSGFVPFLNVTRKQIPFFFAEMACLNQENEDLFAGNFNLTPYRKYSGLVEFMNGGKRIYADIIKYHEFKHVIDNIMRNNCVDIPFTRPIYLSELSANLYTSINKVLFNNDDSENLMMNYANIKKRTEERLNKFLVMKNVPEFVIECTTETLKNEIRDLEEVPRKLKEVNDLCDHILQENILSARKLSYFVATNIYEDEHLKNSLHILINYYPDKMK